MNLQHMIYSSSLHADSCRIPRVPLPFARSDHPQSIICFFKSSITTQYGYANSFPFMERQQSHVWKIPRKRREKFYIVNLKEEAKSLSVEVSRKKGTIAGAVALIIGTSIGSGILALPKKTSPAGILPTSISMIICWAFLLVEALLLVEINVGLLKKKKPRIAKDELEVISIRTMAQETLGDVGGAVATLTYVFLGYTSMIAYSSKSGEILFRLINLPESVSGIFFTSLFTSLLLIGGTRAMDQVNQWLTTSMIGLLVAIEVLAMVFGRWTGMEGNCDWGKVPATLPVMIFTLVYHDLAPVLCAYLGGDLRRIRASVLLGSIVPLLALLVWEGIALGLSNQADLVADPVELLMSVQWNGVSFMVETFSLLAVGTSLIGTLLSFSAFFKEQLNKNNLFMHSPVEKSEVSFSMDKWWGRNKISFTATAMVIAPSLFISSTVPEAFSAATDIAGGYCMTMLYGVLPPAMAWAMKMKQEKGNEETTISTAGPALVVVGLFASGIVVEQILEHLSWLHL